MQGQRGLSARFGAEHFDDPAAGKPVPSQRQIERQGPVEIPARRRAIRVREPHDRTLAEGFFDLPQGVVQHRLLVEAIMSSSL
jgi:hypothetical protein